MEDDEGVESGVGRVTRPARAGLFGIPSHVAWAALILIVALAGRSFWVAYAPRDASRVPLSDPAMYYRLAVGLAQGQGYVSPWTGDVTAYYPPGYPMLVGGLFRVFGVHISVAWGANIVLGALTCVALYGAGWLLIDRRTGVVAGLLMAVLPAHIFFSPFVLSEVFFTFLLAVGMMLMALMAKPHARWSVSTAMALGVVVGVAALVRGQGLLLVPTAALFWLLCSRDWAWTLERATLVMLIAIAVITPWTVRNWARMGSLVFISTNDGTNLYIGHHPGATGGLMIGADLPVVALYESLDPPEREAAISNAEMREGLKFMFTHPAEELRLTFPRLRKMYENANVGLWWSAPATDKPVPHFPVILRIAQSFYYGLVIAAIGGILFWLRKRPAAIALPLVVVGMFSAGQLLFFGDPRYQFPLLPCFALLAAAGLVAAFDRLRRPSSLPPGDDTTS
jgi:4-amino-4-deoxy-L-arabinose transferase-like glycosyltransferase